MQDRIARAGRIAVVGGGAVGVQVASDVMSFHGEKEGCLVHSGERVLSSFGGKEGKLCGYVMEMLGGGLGVEVILGERLEVKGSKGCEIQELVFGDGRKEEFDLIILCTGQTPNSSLIAELSPHSISPTTGRVLVKPTLQLDSSTNDNSKFNNIFALGDVAETFGPKMARAGMMLAEIVCSNIYALITGKKLKEYKPMALEGALKLSLGKEDLLMYIHNDDGSEMLVPMKSKGVDLDVKQMWWSLGMKFEE